MICSLTGVPLLVVLPYDAHLEARRPVLEAHVLQQTTQFGLRKKTYKIEMIL